MELPINRDPQKIKNSLSTLFKPWQLVCFMISFVIVIIACIMLIIVGVDVVAGILPTFAVLPLCYIASFKKKNLDFFEYMKSKKSNKKFYYETYIPKEKKDARKRTSFNPFVAIFEKR